MSNEMRTYAEVSKLVGTGAVGKANQGWSVKLSEDGNFLLIGAYADNSGIGAVWFYQKINGVWTQKQKIVPTGYTGSTPRFGCSIAVNPSMTMLIVGAYGDSSSVGASFVFTFDDTTWAQQAKLVGNGGTGANGNAQGFAVALSADINTAIAGGPNDGSYVGAAWIFVRSGSTWSQQGSKLVGNDSSGTGFQGYAVALTSDGNLAVVGGVRDNAIQGAIWVYLRSAGNSWNQVGTKITANGEVGAGSVGLIALSGDDQTLVVGGPGDNSDFGAAWIFKRNGNTFTQFGKKLVGVGATASSFFGFSVAVNKLGTLVAVGARGDSNSAGAVFMYYFNGTAYKQLGNKFVAGDAIGSAYQGYSVSLDGSGSQLLFGGYNDNGGAGAAWIYVNTTITNSPSAAPIAPTMSPSKSPTLVPTIRPTQPSLDPTSQPSLQATFLPSFAPSVKPTTKPAQDTPAKPASAFSNTSSPAFLSVVIIVPVFACACCALIYFFLRVYKKPVNNKGEIALHGKNLGKNNNADEDGSEAAPMENPLTQA